MEFRPWRGKEKRGKGRENEYGKKGRVKESFLSRKRKRPDFE